MKKILLLLLFTVASYGQAVFDEGIQITGNANSVTATKVNVQETDGKVNTKTINTAFNKNFGLNTGDVVGATTLLNQYSATPVDWTSTSFSSGQVVFYGGKQWIAKMATVAGDVPAVSSKWEEITFEALANKTVTVDQTIIDGSTNAVSGNAVFDGLALKSNIGHTHVASQITDLSKASVGLGNVDNTSDLSKPLSTATINALATKAPISSVHNPVTIGTANGLSLATQQLSLGLASSGVTGALSGTDWNNFNSKQNNLVSGTNIKTIEGQSLLGSGNIDLSKASVGLGNVDNTSDANKPISIATQTALDSKAPVSGSANYIQNQAATPQSANMWINGRIAWGNSVDNGYLESSPANGTNFVGKTGSTNDFIFHNGLGQGVIENPTGTQNVVFKGSSIFSSSVTATSFNGSATLTGTPTAPTAPAGTNTNQIATTAFVQAVASSGIFTPTTSSLVNLIYANPIIGSSYIKIGNIVYVSIRFGIKAVAAGSVFFNITLPFNRTLTSQLSQIGLANLDDGAGYGIVSFPPSTNNVCRVFLIISQLGDRVGVANFQYSISE